HPGPTLFPYTTLFRSKSCAPAATFALTEVAPPFGTVPTTITVFVTVLLPPQAPRVPTTRSPHAMAAPSRATVRARATPASITPRSEEHTSELQSRSDL